MHAFSTTIRNLNLTEPGSSNQSRPLLGTSELDTRWRHRYHGRCARGRVAGNVNHLDHNVLGLANRSVSTVGTRSGDVSALYRSVDPCRRQAVPNEFGAGIVASMGKVDLSHYGCGSTTKIRDAHRFSQIQIKQDADVSYEEYRKDYRPLIKRSRSTASGVGPAREILRLGEVTSVHDIANWPASPPTEEKSQPSKSEVSAADLGSESVSQMQCDRTDCRCPSCYNRLAAGARREQVRLEKERIRAERVSVDQRLRESVP